jgi:hypothetical protein
MMLELTYKRLLNLLVELGLDQALQEHHSLLHPLELEFIL